MRSAENVNISWKDYDSHLCSSVKYLRNDSEFSDVTIVCENTQVNAHKVILASSSLFLRRVLHDNPNPHPLIYLRGVKMKDMMGVLDYMYSGQVQVAVEDVESLLEMCKEFEIKGFELQRTETSSKTTRKRKSTVSSISPPSKHDGPPLSWAPNISMADFSAFNSQVHSSMTTTWISQDVLDDMLIKSEPNGSYDDNHLMPALDGDDSVGDVSEIDHITEPIESPEIGKHNCQEELSSLILTGNDQKYTYKCGECHYMTGYKSTMVGHIEAKHLPGIYVCPWPSCDKILTTDKARRIHVQSKHCNTM